MKVKENPVRLGVPASETSMNDQFQHALFIDPSLEPDELTAKHLQKATVLHFRISKPIAMLQIMYSRLRFILLLLPATSGKTS